MGERTVKSLVSFSGTLPEKGVADAMGLSRTVEALEVAAKIDEAVKSIESDESLAQHEKVLRAYKVVEQGTAKIREKLAADLDAKTKELDGAYNKLPSKRLASAAKSVDFHTAREVAEICTKRGFAWLMDAPDEMRAAALRAAQLGLVHKGRLQNILDRAIGHASIGAVEKERRAMEEVSRALEAVERRKKLSFPPSKLQAAKQQARKVEPFEDKTGKW